MSSGDASRFTRRTCATFLLLAISERSRDGFDGRACQDVETGSSTLISRRWAIQATMAMFGSASVSSPQQAQAASALVWPDKHKLQPQAPVVQPPLGSTTRAVLPSSVEESLSGFVAGAALAATKTIVKYPLDTATVRLQIPDNQYSIRDLPELFNGSFNGVATPLLANIPGAAVFFAVRDACKASLESSAATDSWSPWIQTCLAVAAAQIPYWLVRNPSEVVKTRQQANAPGYTEGVSMVQGYKKVLLDSQQLLLYDGVNGTETAETQAVSTTTFSTLLDAFYLGYWENMLYAYPADVIKFLVYDSWTRKLGGKKNLSPAQGAVAGAFATAIAQLVTTPLDVVRNRLMVNACTNTNTTKTRSESSLPNRRDIIMGSPPSRNAAAAATTAAAKMSYWDTLAVLAETEGLPGLFAGSAPRVGKALVSGAIQFATYEETKRDIARLLQNGRGTVFPSSH